MKTIIWEKISAQKQALVLQRPAMKHRKDLLEGTLKIINSVRNQGDQAIYDLTRQFDQVSLNDLEVSPTEFVVACKVVTNQTKKAMKNAYHHIMNFHRAQYPKKIKIRTGLGIVCEKQARPIAKVGLYIPGGTAPLLSTVLMLGIPAKIARCPTRILCTPPRKNSTIDPHILYAAKLCGIQKVFKVGGAQAIAAMAYGTATIPKVHKIFGPGNAWVTQAKILVAQDQEGAAYDMPAGPSEVMVIADDTANPIFIAADLLSQAEHGADSQVFLITDSQNIARKVILELSRQLKNLPRREIAQQSLNNSFAIVVDNLTTAIAIANEYAPEHLILQTANPRRWQSQINQAGSVFLGKWSPESVGDYGSGTNHVLPTYGYAKCYSGLGVSDFMLQVTFQELTFKGLKQIAKSIETLATIEGLTAHQRAITIRTNGDEL